MHVSGDNVIVVIGGDDHYKDESEEEQSVISRWAWRKIAHCQFKEEFIDGRKSFVFSWAKKHRPIHEEALLHYFDPDKKGQKFEYQPKPKQGGSRKPAESLSPRSPWHKAQSMDEQRGEDRSFSRSNSVGQKGQDTSFSRTKSTEQRGEEGLLLRAYSVGPKGKDTLFSGTNIAGQRGEDGSPGYFNSAEEKTDESSFLPFNSSSAEQRREDSLKREHKTAQSTRVTKPRRNVAVEVPEQSSISCETQSGGNKYFDYV